MTKETNTRPETDTVEIIHRVNRLKEKVCPGGAAPGDGFIDPRDIKRAAAVIAKSAKASKSALAGMMKELDTLWNGARSRSFAGAGELGIDSYRLCNRIQDIAITYGSNVVGQFADSLKEFSLQFNPQSTAHMTIVDAHLSVMKIAVAKRIVLEDSREALELKKALEKAIEKHAAPDAEERYA